MTGYAQIKNETLVWKLAESTTRIVSYSFSGNRRLLIQTHSYLTLQIISVETEGDNPSPRVAPHTIPLVERTIRAPVVLTIP